MEILKKEANKNDLANDKHKSDYEFAIQFNRWLFRPLGVWPLNSKDSRLEKTMSIISVIYCIFFLLFLTIPGCLDMLLIKDLETGLKKVGPLSFNITNTIKYTLLIIHQDKLSLCLKTVFEDWRDVKDQKDREIMINSVNTARNFILICICFMFGGGLSFCTTFPLLANSVAPENSTVRNLAFSGHFIVFDEQERPFYDIVFFIQCLCTIVTCSLTCGVCSMTILFVMHICGQLQIVMELLDNLVIDDQNKEFQNVNQRLAYIVERHTRSLRMAVQVETLVNEICLVEFLSSTFGICLMGYYIIAELENENITGVIYIYCMLFSSYLFNIFIFCYISELLLGQCENVGKKAYMINWNSLPEKKARNLIPIIIISSRPAKLNAGYMVSFSILCFCNVLKASAAYLNAIRTFVK